MKWVKPEYGSGRIDTAGKIVAARRAPSERMDMDEALGIAANWRSSHAYPLQVFTTLLRDRAKRVDPKALVVQRLKRMPSIIAKLKRFEHMHSNAGSGWLPCNRLNPERSFRTRIALRKSWVEYGSLSSQKRLRQNPKEDGYRGIHLVYEYQSTDQRQSVYNGNRIEIQIRTHMQHVWAAAVETVDTFTEQSLKSGIGHNSWKRFFAVTAALISGSEFYSLGLDLPPEIQDKFVNLLNEFQSLSLQLKVQDVLSHLVLATETLRSASPRQRDGWQFYIFLLKLKTPEDTIIYKFRNNVDASERYIELEKEHIEDPFTQLVLVSGDSVVALRKAYPNYFHDAAEFIAIIEGIGEAWERRLGPNSEYGRRGFEKSHLPAKNKR